MRIPLCLGGGAWVARRASFMGLFCLLLFLRSMGCRCIGHGLRNSPSPSWRLLAQLLLPSTCPQSFSARVSVCFRTYRVQDFWPSAQSAPGLGKPEAALLS